MRPKEIPSPSQVRLQVWTARLSRSLVDPDLFDVTRGFVRRHPVSRAWLDLPEHERERRRVVRVREIDRESLGLYALARRCQDEGMPALAEPWAPPDAILRPALAERERVKALRAEGRVEEAGEVEQALWEAYAPRFQRYLRHTYRARAEAWGWLLGRERVVLACPCADAGHCHRTLTARALAACGATLHGDIDAPSRPLLGSLTLFDRAPIEPVAQRDTRR
jgi:hypothetical protein